MMRFLPLGVFAILIGCGGDNVITKQNPTLSLAPDVLDVGNVTVGEEVTGTFTVSDVGGAQATISSISVSNDQDGDYFTFVDSPPEVPRLGSADFTIHYTPTTSGYHTATVTVTYDNPSEPELTAVVRGHADIGSARLYPSLLDFGNVEAGGSKTLAFTIANDGLMDLSLDGATFSDPSLFTLTQTVPYALPAGAATDVEVQFTAASSDAVDATCSLDLGGVVVLPDVVLRANDCERGDPAVYDEDEDGYTSCGGDCDDHNGTAHPGGTETADGTDEDCDGTVDEGTVAYDDDGDGFSENDGDCNDGDSDVSPAGTEVMNNGVDDDCDGVVDQGTLDADYDGYSEAGGDCEDRDNTVYPNAPELADGQDNDCDGIVDEGTVNYDDDGDGMTETSGDCDDTDRTIYAGATESADWQDNDCDGTVDEGTNNYDDDGDGFTENGGDCNDASAGVNPAAEEISRNGIDDNCDGTTS